MAHFLEHMVFKGGKHIKEGEFDKKIEEIGGTSNAATGFDDVQYYVQVPHEFVEQAIKLLLDLVLEPLFEEHAFNIEKEVVLEEIAQINDSPEDQIYQNLFKLCWREHPYGKSILGIKNTLKKITPEKMQSFHKNFYTGDNIVMSIAGKVPEEIKNILDISILKDIKSYSIKNRNKEILVFNKKFHEIQLNRIEIARFIMAWPLPPSRNHEILMGYDIASTILAEGRNSKLIKRLREELQIIESIEMEVNDLEEGGLLILEVCCSPNNILLVENEINNILKCLLTKPIKEKEIKRAHQIIRSSIYYSLESPNNIASFIGSHILWNKYQRVNKQLNLINKWSDEKLKNEIFNLIQPKDCTKLIVKPK